MKKIVVSFAIPENLKRALDRYCKKHKRSRSDVVTNIIAREVGDFRQDDIAIKDCHTFHVFCDSSTIQAVLHGSKKSEKSPELYIRDCILRDAYKR